MASFETRNADLTRMDALINLAYTREVIRKVTEVILPLNDVGFGPPFYCVHSLVGAASEFRDMARMLGPNQKFYGIQTPTEKRNAKFGKSIKEMSKYYVDALVKFQPDGAFLLGGYSVGATIALEMSHQLIARGREVSLLVVFDGNLSNTSSGISSHHPLYWLKLLLNFPRSIVEKLANGRRVLANKAAAKLRLSALNSKNHNTPRTLERFINRERFLPDHAAFIRALYASYLDYAPAHYSGRALVFVAKTQAAVLHLRQVKAAWTKIAPSSEVVEIDGTHESIIKMPRGLPAAERLRIKIEEIAERPARPDN